MSVIRAVRKGGDVFTETLRLEETFAQGHCP